MICPSCGTDNWANAAQCSNCHFKFRFGHAYNDPANMTIFRWSKTTDRLGLKIIKYGVLLLLVGGLVLMLIAAFR